MWVALTTPGYRGDTKFLAHVVTHLPVPAFLGYRRWELVAFRQLNGTDVNKEEVRSGRNYMLNTHGVLAMRSAPRGAECCDDLPASLFGPERGRDYPSFL